MRDWGLILPVVVVGLVYYHTKLLWRNFARSFSVGTFILSPFLLLLIDPEHHGHILHFASLSLEWGFTIYWSTLNLDFCSFQEQCEIKLLFPSWKVFWGLWYRISPFEDLIKPPKSGGIPFVSSRVGLGVSDISPREISRSFQRPV